MYRPDRIGPWPIGNLNRAFVVDTKATFVAPLQTTAFGYTCYSLNTTSGDSFIAEHVLFNNATGPVLSNAFQIGFGVQLSGGGEEFNRHIYSVSGAISFTHLNGDAAHIECVIGRLAAAPSATAGIVVANPIVLPVFRHGDGKVNYACINTSVISTELDGGTPPSTFFDVAAFWRVVNHSGGDNPMLGLQVNIAMHKYLSDLQTLDPNR